MRVITGNSALDTALRSVISRVFNEKYNIIVYELKSTVYEKTDYFVFEGKRCPIEANNPALVLEVLRAEIFLRPNSAPRF